MKGNYEGKETKKKPNQKKKNRKQKTVGETCSSGRLAPKYLRCHREKKKCLPIFSSFPSSFGAKKIRKIPQFFLPLLSLSEVREIAALSYITPGRSVRMVLRGGEQ